ncbi:MAG: hypothetical protein SH818_00890 [Saprospiraceae bacterium]|nr:hypothetical protein [Saprospiraceae bacterium]
MNRIEIDKSLADIALSVELFEELGSIIAYSPGLDLAGQGDSQEEAIESLKSIVNETIEWSINNGTLFEMLLDHGWTVRKLPKPSYIPPKLEISRKKKLMPGYQVREIPVFA